MDRRVRWMTVKQGDIEQERAEARLTSDERFELAFKLLDQSLRVSEENGHPID